jgi:hypothetical protein
MMSTPSWLYYFFGALMLAVAAYGMVLSILTVAVRRPVGWDVAVSHFFMGVSMAGMFVAQWAFGRSAMWEIIFAVLLVWFLVRSMQSVQQWGLHLPHWLIHAVMNFAMLLMYWFPMQASGASTGSMSMSVSSTSSRVDPGLAFVLAFILFASAIFTLASPNKGASYRGTHAPAYAMTAEVGSRASASDHGGEPASLGAIEALVATPWLEDLSHVVMCVAMGFMLILMI